MGKHRNLTKKKRRAKKIKSIVTRVVKKTATEPIKEIYDLFIKPMINRDIDLESSAFIDVMETIFGSERRDVFEAKIIRDFPLKCLRWMNKDQSEILTPPDENFPIYLRRGSHVYIRFDVNNGARLCEIESKNHIFVLSESHYQVCKDNIELIRLRGKDEFKKPDLRIGSRDGV